MAAKDGTLGDWLPEIPDEVQAAADTYIKCLRAKGKAQEKLNSAKESCIEAMTKHDIERVRIDEGNKWLVCEDRVALKTEKIKSDNDADEDD